MFDRRRDEIISEAKRWLNTRYILGGNSRRGIDCSHFVWQVYSERVSSLIPPDFFTNRGNDGKYFVEIPRTTEKKGDLVVWGNEHIGIVVDPISQSFIGAQTSTGVAIARYGMGYWAAKRDMYFLQIKEEYVTGNKPNKEATNAYYYDNHFTY